jgi:hypothetical protein
VTRFPWWVEALAIGVASRIFSIGLLVGSYFIRWPQTAYTPFRTPFVIWDGEWYTWIASRGYHAAPVIHTEFGPGYHDFAFFPAFPQLIRLVSLDGKLPIDWVAPILANLLFLLAVIPIWVVLERLGGRSYARFGLVLFAFSPAAYVYSLAYSEPLFLLFAGMALANTGAGRSAIFALLAQLTRVSGAALAFAGLADLRHRETRLRGVLVILACVAAFGAWWYFIAKLTGDPFGYMLGTPSWFTNQRAEPIPTGLGSILTGHNIWVSAITIPFIGLLLIGTWRLLREGHWRLGLFCLACIGSTWLDTVDSMPRLAAIAFPAFGALGAVLGTGRKRWVVLAFFLAAQIAMGAAAESRYLVP